MVVPALRRVRPGLTAFAALLLVAGLAVTLAATSRPAGADPTTSGGFVALSPARILDSRYGTGGVHGPVAGDRAFGLTVLGAGGIPSTGVAAVALNVTVTGPTAAGALTVYPAGGAVPHVSNVNFVQGQTVANLVTVGVGTGGEIDFLDQSTGSAQVIADVSGYYTGGTATAPGAYVALTPSRVLDTRYGTGAPKGLVAGGHSIELTLSGVGGVPAGGASAVVLNLTETGAAGAGALTVYPTGASEPGTSNLNYVKGQTVANQVVATLGSDGRVTIAASTSAVQVIADVEGYFRSGVPLAAGTFVPRIPYQTLDTRYGTGVSGGGAPGPVGANQTVQLTAAADARVPGSGAAALVLNLTVTGTAAAGNLTIYPDGETRPTASVLNYAKGETAASQVVVPVPSDGLLDISNNSLGSTQVIADVVGFMTDGSLGAITGTVTEQSSGDPLAGVEVSVAPDGGTLWGPAPLATTGPAGTFTVAGLLPQNDDVCFHGSGATGGTSGTAYSDACDQDSPTDPPTPVAISAGQTTSGVDGELPPGLLFTGTVTDTSGHPLGNVLISPQLSTDSSYFTPTARTSADGAFRMAALPWGFTACTVSAGATGGTSVIGYIDQCESLSAGAPLASVNFELVGATGLSGVVTDSAGHPLAGVPVVIAARASEAVANATDNQVAYTDAEGRWTAILTPANPSSSHYVCFLGSNSYLRPKIVGGTSNTGYSSQCWDQVPYGPDATLTQIGAPAGALTSGISVQLAAAAEIKGIVTAGTAPAGGTLVTATPSAPSLGGLEYDVDTAANGTFDLTGLYAGNYTICAFTSPSLGGAGYTNQCYQAQAPATASPSVSVAAGQIRTGVTIGLNRGGELAGVVHDAGGNPLAGISVYLDGLQTAPYMTDHTGSFDISHVASGKHTLCFQSPGTATAGAPYGVQTVCYDGVEPGSTNGPILVQTGTRTSVEQTMLSRGQIVVSVTDSSGQPLQGVTVRVSSEPLGTNGAEVSGGQTGPDGLATVPELDPGTYYVCEQVSTTVTGGTAADGYAGNCPTSTPAVTVQAGVSSNVSAALDGLGEIDGVVSDTGGTPLDQAFVQLYAADDLGNSLASQQTGQDGSYAFHGLAPGDYVVCFSASLKNPQCWDDKAFGDPAATPIHVADGQAVTDINASLDG